MRPFTIFTKEKLLELVLREPKVADLQINRAEEVGSREWEDLARCKKLASMYTVKTRKLISDLRMSLAMKTPR